MIFTDEKALINRVNEQVSITSLLRRLDTFVPHDIQGSVKIYCPFGQMHPDGGMSQAMRVYPGTNTCFCVAENLQMTPVKLWALAKDLSNYDAALDLSGELQREEEIQEELKPDKAALAAALNTYCNRVITDWEERQFDDRELANTYSSCLSLLTYVEDDPSAERWLQTCKIAMQKKGSLYETTHKQAT